MAWLGGGFGRRGRKGNGGTGRRRQSSSGRGRGPDRTRPSRGVGRRPRLGGPMQTARVSRELHKYFIFHKYLSNLKKYKTLYPIEFEPTPSA